jgi:hypothetical protein
VIPTIADTIPIAEFGEMIERFLGGGIQATKIESVRKHQIGEAGR